MNEYKITTNNEDSKKFWMNEHINDLSWYSKTCVYHRILFDHIDIPKDGDVVQLGVGFGLSLQLLIERFGERCYGIDIFNPAEHPAVKIMDVRDLKDVPLSYVHCNVGKFDSTPVIRKIGLEWSLRNLVSGGYCCTAGNNEYVESFLGFRIRDLAEKYNCEILPIPLDDEVKTMNSLGKFNSAHDCLIKKQ